MSDGGEKTCPLCAEEMDMTDQQLKPCKCGYEICVWCWHHIMDMAEKDDSEGRCPACRSAYDKEKIVGMTANCGRLVTEGSLERKKSQKSKAKIFDSRKQLSSVRVIQRNLVYIVGLPLSVADEDLLQNREYFGQYGKVLKVSMSRTTTGAIQQFPNNTCSVYITYTKEEEAIRCIQSVHGFILDGKSLKACFGTTKYCHAWLRNVACTNPDCLYLHEVGSQEDSFTKDEIISAYTRNRVQQVMGATTTMLRKSGNVLPPPIDDYNTSASIPKPIVRSTSNSTVAGKNSPPNGRSPGLPPAASWGMRPSNLPPASENSYSLENHKLKLDPVLSTTVPSSTPRTTLLQSDKSSTAWDDDDDLCFSAKGKLDPVSEDVKSYHAKESSGPVGLTKEEAFLSREQTNLCYDSGTDSTSRNDIFGSSSSFTEYGHQQSNRKQVFPSHGDQNDSSLFVPANENASCSLNSGSLSDQHGKVSTDVDVEDDVISFENQRLKDPEVICRSSYVGNHSKYIGGGICDSIHRQPSSNFESLNGYSYSEANVNNVEKPQLFRKDSTSTPSISSRCNSLSDMRESSIITDILSLDLGSWDDTLSSPHSLVKLLSDSDKLPMNLNCSTSAKLLGNSQSRFSFARQDEPVCQPFNVHSSINTCQLPTNLYVEKMGGLNGFSSNFGEPRASSNNFSPFSSSKPVSRGQISAPPGFCSPSRPPPPGFSSHGRVEQNCDLFSAGNYVFDSLPRNSYQASFPSNVGISGDLEFMDPAILAVGKGRLQDAPWTQRTSSPNLISRYTDNGVGSGPVDQSQAHHLPPWAHLPHNQSRDPPVTNGHWNGWNEMQGGSTLAMAELLRNERLGVNKLYGGNSYEDGNLCNRTLVCDSSFRRKA